MKMHKENRPLQLPSLCLLLIVVTLAAYIPVRHNPFINLDDEIYITNNSHVNSGLSWNTFTWAWTTTDASNWHPLTWLSHALDCQLFGLDPAGHHLVSLVVHILNALILFLLLVQTTGAPWSSFLVSALFALHPINVESVAWAAERKNVLCTLFFLLTLGAYAWYVAKPNISRYSLVALCFALGLAAKPMVITLPFVLLLLDFWPLKRTQRPQQRAGPEKAGNSAKRRASRITPSASNAFSRVVLEKLPLLALCAGSAAITVFSQHAGGSIRSLEYLPFRLRLENALVAYGTYTWKALWPAQLTLFYPFPVHGLAIWRLALAFCFLVGMSLFAWKQRFIRRYLLVGWLWYLGTLIPVIGIVQVGDQAMADRYAYIPLIGVFIIIVWATAEFADRVGMGSLMRAVPAVLILGALGFCTRHQVGYWRTSADLWAHSLEATKVNYVAEVNLAGALRTDGYPEKALLHYQKATALRPLEPNRHVNLANDLAECGRLPEAIAEYQAAAQLTHNPKVKAQVYESIAALYSALGNYSEARQGYEQALRADPQQAQEMIDHVEQGLASQPSGELYMQLALLLQLAGKLSDAHAAYEQAVKLDPTLEHARDLLNVSDENKRN